MPWKIFNNLKTIKLSLNKANKNFLIIALVSLFYRKGNFYNTFIPKPFEIFFIIFGVLAAIDIVRNRNVKKFLNIITKNIQIAILFLLLSILIGWINAVFLKNIPSTFNMVLEFGTFIIGLSTLLIILFYLDNDEVYARKYFYALLAPVVFIVVVIFPTLSGYFGLTQDGNFYGNFLGFTSNPNIISKTLLIPAMFFIAMSLFEHRNRLFKLGCIFISSALITLLLWTASRGAILSLLLGAILIGGVFVFYNFNLRKVFSGIIIFCVIFSIGFLAMPYSRKQVALNRLLNKDTVQISANELESKALVEIIQQSLVVSSARTVSVGHSDDFSIDSPYDTRMVIWGYYFGKIIKNPLGFGPNTHMESRIEESFGNGYLSSGPHNSYLQIWLWGGLLGIFSFLYILLSAFNNLRIKLQSNFNIITLSLIASLFALSIAIMFDDSLSLYHFWIILALSLRK